MDKVSRILRLFHSLIQGQKLNKADFAKSNNISERSVDRDIEDIPLLSVGNPFQC